MTSVTEAVLTRRSKRAFLDRPVPADLLRTILTVAQRAPSSSNMQPWRVYASAGEDLARLKARVRESLAANPKGEGAEYRIYAPELKDPYNARRLKCAEDMYATIDLARDNRMGRLMHFARNFDFYGAPVGVVLAIDRTMEPGQWADTGAYLQTLLLLLAEAGLDACPQAAWAAMPRTLRAHFGMDEALMVYCGVSVGYADPAHPINSLVTDRADLAEAVEMRGFELSPA